MKYCVHFIFKDEQILLLKRKDSNPFYPSIWTPIIGKLKKEEDPFKAVVRETIEETQLKIDNPKFIKLNCLKIYGHFLRLYLMKFREITL